MVGRETGGSTRPLSQQLVPPHWSLAAHRGHVEWVKNALNEWVAHPNRWCTGSLEQQLRDYMQPQEELRVVWA